MREKGIHFKSLFETEEMRMELHTHTMKLIEFNISK